MVTNSESGEAKVALKEVTENQVSFELTAENFSDEAVSYEVDTNVQTDTPVDAGVLVVAPNEFGAMDLGDLASVDGEPSSTIEVPANDSATFTVSLDVSSMDASLKDIFTNGYWLEGFVTLTDPTDTNPELNVPYVGFKGGWDSAPIFDTPMWDPTTFYGSTGVGTDLGEGSYGFLGADPVTEEINPEDIAFSPNGDGVQDDAILILSFLRNAKEATFNVLDEDENVVRTLTEETFLRKNYFDGGLAPSYSLLPDRTWDGTIDGEIAPEGQYYLEAEAVIDFADAEAQSLTLPVILDTTEPEAEAEFSRSDREVYIEVSDNEGGSGVASWEIFLNGEPALDAPITEEKEYTLTDVHPSTMVTVKVVDHAGNEMEGYVAGPPRGPGNNNGNGNGNNGNNGRGNN
ncbi:Fn3-like domain-containing protein [Virgibacillus natechei]|nr:Fn3-like domain-containing protein [Virgibacillus natechei]